MASDRQYIKASRALIGRELREDVVLVIGEGGRIEQVLPGGQCEQPCLEFKDCTLLPGMIDTHVHGAMGHDVMDASHESLEVMSQFFAANGVTGFVATTVTAPVQKIKQVLLQIGASKRQGLSGASLLGGYLEGPYFTARHKGAHPEYLFRELDTQELDSWISYANGSLLTVALAPEKNGAEKAIRHLNNKGVRVMLGHSDAGAEQVQAAFAAGASGLVHCYNGMRGLHHRDPGVVGVGLCQSDSYTEIIADGHHVHPVAADVAHRCCGDRLMLITDAMQAAGMPDGAYMLGEYQVQVSQGIARTDAGGLAGSTLKLIDAVANLSQWLNMPFEQAWLSASLTPARFLGMEERYGLLEADKQASMVAVADNKQVLNTWVDGNMVYAADNTIISEAVCI